MAKVKLFCDCGKPLALSNSAVSLDSLKFEKCRYCQNTPRKFSTEHTHSVVLGIRYDLVRSSKFEFGCDAEVCSHEISKGEHYFESKSGKKRLCFFCAVSLDETNYAPYQNREVGSSRNNSKASALKDWQSDVDAAMQNGDLKKVLSLQLSKPKK